MTTKYSPEIEKLLDEEVKEHFEDSPGATHLIYPSKVVPGIVYASKEVSEDEY